MATHNTPAPDLHALLRQVRFSRRFAAAATVGPMLHGLLRAKQQRVAAQRRELLLAVRLEPASVQTQEQTQTQARDAA